MRFIVTAALAAVALVPVAAQAQGDTAVGSFGGFRLEGNIGWDKAQAFNRNNEKLGYGGSFGFDGNVTERVVIGPEVSYWHPNNGGNTVVAPGGLTALQGRDQWGSAVRVGFRATPDLLVFGKGGYVNRAQRTYVTNALGATTRSSDHVGGYQVGGGAQYAPHDRFSFTPANMYLSAQYVYSDFGGHVVDQHAMAGVGLRFR